MACSRQRAARRRERHDDGEHRYEPSMGHVPVPGAGPGVGHARRSMARGLLGESGERRRTRPDPRAIEGWLGLRLVFLPPTDGRREHAIHELLRRLAPEELGQLDRLVDDRRGRRIAEDPELEERNAQDVAVDRGHLRQRELGRQRLDLLVQRALVLEHSFDQLPGEIRGVLGQPRAERAPFPGLLRIGAIEVDLEERLERHATRRMTARARRTLLHWSSGAVAAVVPIASTSFVATARCATAIAHRIMFARARPCVTTETAAMPRSGAETYGS